MLAQTLDTDPWQFQWHPEVWLLVAFLSGAYLYTVRVIGPRAVGAGNPVVTRGNVYAFKRENYRRRENRDDEEEEEMVLKLYSVF